MDQPLLTDVPQAKGHPIAHLLRISNVEIKVAKNGRKYLQFNLGDKSAEFKGCKKWESSDEEFERFKKCKVVFVTGKTDLYNGNLNVTCETLAEPEDSVEIADLENLAPSTTSPSNGQIPSKEDYREFLSKQTTLKATKSDDSISHIFRIVNFEVREAKNGNPYAQFKLSDATSEVLGKQWDIDKDKYTNAFAGIKAVFITGAMELYQGNLQLKIASAEPIILEDTDLQRLYKSSSYEVSFLKKELWRFIQGIGNKFIRELCLEFLKDSEVKERLSTSPAAIVYHHAYYRGLLTHIVRLMYLADGVADAFNNHMYPDGKYTVNKDVLVFGVLCHDLYKIREYNDMEYADDGNLIGHLPLGAIQANRFMDRIPEFPDEIRKQLTHLVLSHHGTQEFGSPTTPCTVEAVILHFCDDMAAKVDPMLEALDALPEGVLWTTKLKGIDKKAYMGGRLIPGKEEIVTKIDRIENP